MEKDLVPEFGRERVMQKIEQKLIEIWENLFGRKDISPDSDFFELGGNSITAIKFIAEVEQQFGNEVLLPDVLFANSQLAHLAQSIEKCVNEG